MSVEAEKVIPQEQSAGPATLATAVVGIPGASDITEKAKPDGENKVDSNANQVAPIAAVVSEAADPLVGNDSTPISNDVGDKGVTSVVSGESNLSTGAENALSDPAQPPAEPIVAASAPAGGTGANGIVDKADTTIPVKSTEEVVPETTEKPSQTVSDGKSTGDSIEVKNGNGTANGDVEMSEAPKEVAVTKDEAVKEASAPTPVPILKGKRKAEDTFDDDEHDLSEKKAKVDNGVVIAATDTATHRTKKPGRPKKQQQQPQKPRKILTPVGRTLRKTRSQGPVEI